MQIQIKWKDSREYKPVMYRKHTIQRFSGGWIVSDMTDDIFHCIECAENFIDESLGGKTRKACEKRHSHGIHVIGKNKG